jgi:hypothetical protein
MKLTNIIKIWDILHIKDTGELGYCDLQQAIEQVVGIQNDINPCQPSLPPIEEE